MNAQENIKQIFATVLIRHICLVSTVLLTMSAAQLSAANLRATCSESNLNLGWSREASNEFYVEASTNPADPASWRILTNEISLAGSDYSVTDMISRPCRFYRLKPT